MRWRGGVGGGGVGLGPASRCANTGAVLRRGSPRGGHRQDPLRPLRRQRLFGPPRPLDAEEEPTAGYGAFPGGDPRLFTPDEEVCTAEELEAHRAACEEATAMEARGEAPEWPSSHGWEKHGEVVMHVTMAGFGLGVYQIDEHGNEG